MDTYSSLGDCPHPSLDQLPPGHPGPLEAAASHLYDHQGQVLWMATSPLWAAGHRENEDRAFHKG